MKTTSFDALDTAVPVDSTAARTVSRGVQWDPQNKSNFDTQFWQDTPPPILDYPAKTTPGAWIPPVGFRVCRLTVLGYGGQYGDGKAKWVVRCSCGLFATRRAKYLRSDHALTRGMCTNCDYLEQLKSGRGWRTPKEREARAEKDRQRRRRKAAAKTEMND